MRTVKALLFAFGLLALAIAWSLIPVTPGRTQSKSPCALSSV
jgi:hypothetical protein